MLRMDDNTKPMTKREKLFTNSVMSIVIIYAVNIALNFGIQTYNSSKTQELFKQHTFESSYVDSCNKEIIIHKSELFALEKLNISAGKDTTLFPLLKYYFNEHYNKIDPSLTEKINSQISFLEQEIENTKKSLRNKDSLYDRLCTNTQKAQDRQYRPWLWFK